MEEGRNEGMTDQPFQIALAGKIIEIRPLHDEIRAMCRDYLLADRTAPDLTVAVTPEQIGREAAEVRREDAKQGISRVCSPAYLETVAVYRQIVTALAKADTLMMHGSVISTEGQGYMITAPSGVGKSTRARLWTESIPDSFVVNGDKPLLKVTDSGIIAYGTPWCGKEGWNVNTAVPLRALFLLERSEEGNTVAKVSFAEAFPLLLRQTFRPDDADAKRITLGLLGSMAGKVKVYRFRSGPTAEAVRMAWEAVRG